MSRVGKHICNQANISSSFCTPLEGVVSLSAVGGAGVEDDLAVEGARLRVPVGRVRQVAHVPEDD